MSNRTWLLVAVALGGGILLQIPSWGGRAEHDADDGHDHAELAAEMAGMDGEMADTEMSASSPEAERPGARTVALEVTGMT